MKLQVIKKKSQVQFLGDGSPIIHNNVVRTANNSRVQQKRRAVRRQKMRART